MQAHGFRVYFTPLLAVLFTFPSRYSSTIGLTVVLSLGGWCRLIRTGFLRPRPTRGTDWVGERFAYGALTLSGPPSHAGSAALAPSVSSALQPPRRLDAPGLGWSPFARRYSGSHCCFPLLRLLGCFGSSGSPPLLRVPRPRAAGFPIRAPADPRLLAPPRGLSRPAAPFVASVSHRHPPCALIHSLAAPRIAASPARPALVCLVSLFFSLRLASCQ